MRLFVRGLTAGIAYVLASTFMVAPSQAQKIAFTLLPSNSNYSVLMRNPADSKNAGVIFLPNQMVSHILQFHGPNRDETNPAISVRSKFGGPVDGAIDLIAAKNIYDWIILALLNGTPDPSQPTDQPAIDYDLGFVIGTSGQSSKVTTTKIRVTLRPAPTQVALVGKLVPGPNVWYIFSAYPRL